MLETLFTIWLFIPSVNEVRWQSQARAADVLTFRN